jgi:hypothetical protein
MFNGLLVFVLYNCGYIYRSYIYSSYVNWRCRFWLHALIFSLLLQCGFSQKELWDCLEESKTITIGMLATEED